MGMSGVWAVLTTLPLSRTGLRKERDPLRPRDRPSAGRRHRRVRHPGRRRQGQGAQGGGRAGDRLRRRRARLPDAGAHRRGRGRGLPRPAEPPLHAGRRACPSCRRRSRPRRCATRATRSTPSAGAGHQRRQARRLQHVRDAARPGRRGAAAGAVLDDLPRADRASPAASPVVLPTDETTGFRVTVDQLEAARTAAHQGCCSSCRRRTRPARCTRASEVEAIGRWAAEHGIWVVTDEIYEHLTYGDHRFTFDADARARARRPLRGAQRRGQDLRHDRLAGRLDDRPGRRHQGGHQPAVALHLERGQRRRSGPRSPRWPATSTPWPRCATAFDRRGRTMHKLLNGHRRGHLHRAAGRVLRLPEPVRACSAGRSAGAGRHVDHSSSPSASSTRPRWRSCPARRSARPATPACRSRSATTTSARASAASPTSSPARSRPCARRSPYGSWPSPITARC